MFSFLVNKKFKIPSKTLDLCILKWMNRWNIYLNLPNFLFQHTFELLSFLMTKGKDYRSKMLFVYRNIIEDSVFTSSMLIYFYPTSLGHPSTTKTSKENPSEVENAWASWIFSPASPSIEVNWNAYIVKCEKCINSQFIDTHVNCQIY